MIATLLTYPRAATAAGLTVALALLGAHPTLAHSVGLDVWNVGEWQEELRDAAEHNQQLDAQDGQVRRRIAAKEAAIAELLAGRTTLAETTELFVELNATRPEYQEVIRSAYPGGSDLEKAARNVISFALARAAPGNRAATADRLEGELRAMLAAGPTH